MKIKVNATSWKKAVAKANSLAGKTTNPNESCVQIHIKEDKSYLFVVEAGVHNTKINLTDIEIEEEGSYYIQATALDNLTKAVFSKEINIQVKDNKLVYEVENLGSIFEPVYHNQAPFHGMVFSTEEYRLVEEGNTSFTSLLKTGLGVFADKLDKDTNSTLSISLAGDNSIISGNTSLAGGLVYTFSSQAKTKFTIKTALLKSMGFILEDLASIKVEQSNTTIQLSSIKGESILFIGKVNEVAVDYLIKSFKQDADSTVLIKPEELTNVVKWQSYAAQDGDCITIYSEEDNLMIKGDRTHEASKISYTENSPFNQVKLPTEAFTKAVHNLAKDSVVTLKVTSTEILNQPRPIKTAFVIVETDGYTSTAYLSEPALLK